MIPLEEAQAYVLAGCEALPAAPAPMVDAHGLVLAEPVVADQSIPPFANTAMDGFAIRSADLSGASDESPVTLEVVATLAAGTAPDRAVRAGEAVRIMTGAPMPEGADAVVMVELTDLADDETTVAVRAEVPVGNHIRHPGEDIEPGQVVFEPGDELSAGHLGVLASLGIAEVSAHRRPRVGVMSTGDELVDGPGPLAPGQIRDSNRCTLLALVTRCGAVGVDLGLVPDTKEALTTALIAGAETCDALLTSGGVSMGAFDYVRVVLDELGDMRWMQVAIKPAKPLAFGRIGTTPVFGLPGNPVSSMVSFELFARPGLRRMMGHTDLHRPRVTAVAASDLRRHADGKTHFARVVAEVGDDGRLHARSAGGQGSHQLAAMAHANALAVLPDGAGITAGEPVGLLLLR
ncbi:MAG: molybdopterin molybdotransferase MoeA [Acidimicrobiia bacterium]|nr:molybdopterin molybdotransferase MoeA [Acidimicrobiia bacterium]